MKLEFSQQIFKKYVSDLMEIHPVGAKLLHVDGQTGRHDKANSHPPQFCERA
jgi:hypothetical protein